MRARGLIAVTAAAALGLLAAGSASSEIVGWHVVSQDEATITYGWTPTPEPTSDGYRFYVNRARVSNTADPLRSTVVFEKVPDATYGITELFRGPMHEDTPQPPAPPPAPPPPPPPDPPPAPPPPPAKPNLILHNQTWTCTGAIDFGLVRITGTANSDAINWRSGCTGHIERLEVDGAFEDCIKVNPPAPAPHDITVESGYCRSTSPPGGHYDGIQMGGGRDITLRNFVMDWCCTGGGNIFIQSFNGGTPINFLCDHCAIGPRHANQVRTPFDASSGVRNSRVCRPLSGRAVFLPASGDKGGNTVPDATSPLCTFESLLDYASSP